MSRTAVAPRKKEASSRASRCLRRRGEPSAGASSARGAAWRARRMQRACAHEHGAPARRAGERARAQAPVLNHERGARPQAEVPVGRQQRGDDLARRNHTARGARVRRAVLARARVRAALQLGAREGGRHHAMREAAARRRAARYQRGATHSHVGLEARGQSGPDAGTGTRRTAQHLGHVHV